jgi:hypothetical protein
MQESSRQATMFEEASSGQAPDNALEREALVAKDHPKLDSA